MTMSASVSVQPLAEQLFVPWERLGWEYVQPAPPVPSPEADRPPVWVEPADPTASKPEAAAASGMAMTPYRGCLLAVAGFFLLGLVAVHGAGVVIGALVGLAVVTGVSGRMFTGVRRARYRRDRDLAFAAYESEKARWRERVRQHDEAEQRRIATELCWFPLSPASGGNRVDVFGGSMDGWASLLTTVGCSLLGSGSDLLLLDFTEQGVGDDLAAFAARQGHPLRELTLPGSRPSWDPLDGLDEQGVAELLADVVRGVRAAAGSAGTADERALDTELLLAVVTRLERPWTHRRIAAGLRVLRRLHDFTGPSGLSDREVELLTAAVDTVGRATGVDRELQFLTNVLDLLAEDEDAAAAQWQDPDQVNEDASDLLHAPGLAVVRTSGGHARRKEALDHLIFHRVARGLRGRSQNGVGRMLAVAGADNLGREPLEELTRQAERCGVRLMLMFERLRGELHDLLGGRDSATLLMRLGNAREAAAAAEFVGRGHSFVLSQLTEQVGATFTEGTAVSTSQSVGVTRNSSWSLSEGHFGKVSVPFAAASHSRSSGISRTETWQNTVNQSVAESTTQGRTVSRVYEFKVEPTTVQSLPTTAFVLVEVGPRGRRVALGDCNPGIALVDRVASKPREL